MLAVLLLLQSTIPAPAWVRPPRPLPPALGESSALAASVRHAGILWTLNDGGNPPELFAIDTAGRMVGRVRVRGVKNTDWEALATGPCPAGRGAGRPCLYIGDIGDNVRARRRVTVFRVFEPDPARDTIVSVLDSLQFVYPDSAHDAESMVVAPNGDLWVISKERIREPRIYRVPAAAWRRRGVVTASARGALPIPSATGVDYWVTDASWSSDGHSIIVRTYGALWRLPFTTGGPRAGETWRLCSLAGLGPQGEGVTALGEDLYALSSESFFGSGASIALVRCRG